MSDTQARAPRPRWTIGGTFEDMSTLIYEHGDYMAKCRNPEIAAQICAALNTQAPPPAESPEAAATRRHQRSIIKEWQEHCARLAEMLHCEAMTDVVEQEVAALLRRAAPPPQPETPCADCDAAAKLAYSDATTPGFFHNKCAKHRAALAQLETLAADLRTRLHKLLDDLATDKAIVIGPYWYQEINVALEHLTLAQPRTVTPETLPKLTAADVRKSRNVSAWDEAIADNLNAILAARTAPPGDGGADGPK